MTARKHGGPNRRSLADAQPSETILRPTEVIEILPFEIQGQEASWKRARPKTADRQQSACTTCSSPSESFLSIEDRFGCVEQSPRPLRIWDPALVSYYDDAAMSVQRADNRIDALDPDQWCVASHRRSTVGLSLRTCTEGSSARRRRGVDKNCQHTASLALHQFYVMPGELEWGVHYGPLE